MKTMIHSLVLVLPIALLTGCEPSPKAISNATAVESEGQTTLHYTLCPGNWLTHAVQPDTATFDFTLDCALPSPSDTANLPDSITMVINIPAAPKLPAHGLSHFPSVKGLGASNGLATESQIQIEEVNDGLLVHLTLKMLPEEGWNCQEETCKFSVGGSVIVVVEDIILDGVLHFTPTLKAASGITFGGEQVVFKARACANGCCQAVGK